MRELFINENDGSFILDSESGREYLDECGVVPVFNALEKENERLRNGIDDLQSGMYINCVYCGHRYGPSDEHAATVVDDGATPSMQDALKAHVEKCPEHPMSRLREQLDAALEVLAQNGISVGEVQPAPAAPPDA